MHFLKWALLAVICVSSLNPAAQPAAAQTPEPRVVLADYMMWYDANSVRRHQNLRCARRRPV